MLRQVLARLAPALALGALVVTESVAFAAPPLPASKAGAGTAKDTAEITFTGFRLLPGGRSVVFVEMTEPVVVEMSRVGQVVEYKLVGARVPLRNNRHPLLMRDFDSSATSAILIREPRKKGVRLVITLRSAVAPTHRMVQHGNSSVLEVELPASASP